MESLQIPCPSCLSANRVPYARLGDGPKCGRCKSCLLSEHPVALDDRTFQSYVENADLPVVVDFWAGWCGPCRMMAPQFEAAARAQQGKLLFAKLDTEAAPGVASLNEIRSIPTLILFRDGREVARQSGALSRAQIESWLAGNTRAA
jgi:thioredoxin 2